jgi:hypothetical protein
MKATLTLKRFYFKEVELEISQEILKNKTEEEIANLLTEDIPVDSEEIDNLFKQAEMYDLEIDHEGKIYEDTDRYDIYDNGEQVYGGHL